MDKIILDTNFILACIDERIDFLDASKLGILILPREVILELEKISQDMGRSFKEREKAGLAVQIILKNKSLFEFVDLERKFVDRGIVILAEKIGRKEAVVASFDRELKRALKGKARLLVIKARGKLAII